jgi:hypothetical protein
MGFSDLKKVYQPRTNIVRDENGYSAIDCYSVLSRWRKRFSQPFNIRGVNNVMQTEILVHTAIPLEPSPSAFEIEAKKPKSQGIDQIPAELIKTECKTIRPEIHELNNSVWSKEEFPEERKKSIIVPIYRKGAKQTVVIIEAFHFANCIQKFIQHSALKVKSIYRRNYWGSSVWISKQQVNYRPYILD